MSIGLLQVWPPPDDIERNIPDWVFPAQQNLPTRHQSRPDGVLVMLIIWGKSQAFGSQTDPPKGQRHTSCRIQILLRLNPATDIRISAQPASTPCPASINKEPPRHLSKQPSHTSCYTSWSRGHNLQSVHHNSFTRLRRPHAQSAPTSY